jgi:hypothetical protein
VAQALAFTGTWLTTTRLCVAQWCARAGITDAAQSWRSGLRPEPGSLRQDALRRGPGPVRPGGGRGRGPVRCRRHERRRTTSHRPPCRWSIAILSGMAATRSVVTVPAVAVTSRTVGVRTIEFTPEQGLLPASACLFAVNCLHHDLGALGRYHQPWHRAPAQITAEVDGRQRRSHES